jgi:hypothetical protein
MKTTKLIDRPRVTGTVIPDITSATLQVPGVRDQNGVVSGVIFNEGAPGTPHYLLQVQGAAEDQGASTVWHVIAQTGSGTGLTELRLASAYFSIEFPLMPAIRLVFTQVDTVNGYERVEAWVTE